MIEPPLLNYEESRFLRTGIKLNYKELMLSTFRLRRFTCAYFELGKVMVHFTSFKYPLFTTLINFYCLFVLIFFGVGFLTFTFVLMMFLYFHPQIHCRVGPVFQQLFFEPERLNKYFIPIRVKSRKELDTEFYMDITNLHKKKETKKTSLKQQFTNAFNFSSRLPKNINFFVNFFEKFKNIFLWKDTKKTQLTVLLFMLFSLSLYLLGLRLMFIFYILWRFLKGPKYFKRVAQWNSEVLHQMVLFFLKNEFKFVGSNTVEFFDSHKDNIQTKTLFSKKFSAFAQKCFEIELSEGFWLDKFDLGKIIGVFLHTEKRLRLPFFD